MFELDTVRELIHLPNLSGMKDSSGDMDYFRELGRLTRDLADFALMIGPEAHLVEAIACGADGGVTGGANLAPRLFVDLFEAALAEDLNRCAALQRQTDRIAETIYAVGQENSRFIKGTKCGLAAMGICDDFVLPPYSRFSDAQRREIADLVDQLQLREVSSGVAG
jgi:4-hydroxy-tetrahydrodipicolinate synthase